MNQTRIDWCDYTWNPVIGCKNNCPYCYAKKINNRFKFIKDYNIPEWRQKVFDQNFPKQPNFIFIGSMSDIEYWEPEWMHRVLEKIKKYQQHTFLFLTKNPDVYFYYSFPKNCWLGVTATNQKQMDCLYSFFESKNEYNYHSKRFISIEPIQERITLTINPDWIIVGAETGNRKNKIIPDYYWIYDIYRYCCSYKIPIFMKDNLKNIWPTNLIQEFPK